MSKKKILFIGAGGALASRVIPKLSETYSIVGIAGRRQELKTYCTDFYTGNLITEYKQLFNSIFQKHTFDAVIWNPVKYIGPLMKTSRESLHIEYDVAIALPLECIRSLLPTHPPQTVFILVSSMAAFGYKTNSASYGMVKKAQLLLAEALAEDLAGKLIVKAIAPSSIGPIPDDILVQSFIKTIENEDSSKTIYSVLVEGLR